MRTSTGRRKARATLASSWRAESTDTGRRRSLKHVLGQRVSRDRTLQAARIRCRGVLAQRIACRGPGRCLSGGMVGRFAVHLCRGVQAFEVSRADSVFAGCLHDDRSSDCAGCGTGRIDRTDREPPLRGSRRRQHDTRWPRVCLCCLFLAVGRVGRRQLRHVTLTTRASEARRYFGRPEKPAALRSASASRRLLSNITVRVWSQIRKFPALSPITNRE